MPSSNDIQVVGACENNLKHVTVSIPKGRLVAFAGVSGSGKSSLAFDTIARESARQWQDNYPLFLRNKMPHYERPHVVDLRGLTPAVVVDQRPLGAGSRSTVGTAVDVAPLLRLLFSRCGEPTAGGSMAYSFNHPAGACPECTGLGTSMVLDEGSLFDLDRSIAEGGICFSQFSSGWQTVYWQQNPLLDPHKKLRDFTDEEWRILKYEAPKDVVMQINSNNTGGKWDVEYEGVIPRFERLYLRRDISKLKKGLQEEILSHVVQGPCSACSGSGLNPAALASKVAGLNIVEMGPGAGSHGGEVVYEGDLAGLLASDTPTARALGEKVAPKTSPRPWTEGFEVRDAHCHNLKHVDVIVPKGVLTCVTGVAGSGKSSLMRHEFTARYPDAIVVDQRPIGTSIRSTPATYTGAMDEIRKLFAKANHVAASWFSFNSKGGCPVCKGKGIIGYEMAFAEPVEVVCEECQGRRYNPTALGYELRGKNIEQVLAMTVDEALEFFAGDDKVLACLRPMAEVGLGYLTLGQPTSTCSGGEVQRIKLSSELGRRGNVYVLDEPSTGLHAKDMEVLAGLLDRLVNAGNTVICIEHRMELIARADWVIDLGPEGGSAGGEVVFAGTPAQLMGCAESKTGRYLRGAAER